MFITYRSDIDVIVTTRKREAKMLRLFFEEDGRDLDDYHREENDDCAVEVRSHMIVW